MPRVPLTTGRGPSAETSSTSSAPPAASLPAASTSNGAMTSSGSHPSNNTICACTLTWSVDRTVKDQWSIGHISPTCCQRVDHYGWVTTGAHVVIDRLIAGGVEVCFANPGTSEMHFVAALDAAPQMRAVLCLFEGVATGAADGCARIAGKPAATLLHLGPGMANGLANLHNARRAHTPVVNVVGDHATHHVEFDAPLESDIEALAGWPEGLVYRPHSAAGLAASVDAAIAGAVGPPGRVATVILPADYSWGPAEPGAPLSDPAPADAGPGGIGVPAAAEMLREYGANTVVLLGGSATTAEGLAAAARIAAATGAR